MSSAKVQGFRCLSCFLKDLLGRIFSIIYVLLGVDKPEGQGRPMGPHGIRQRISSAGSLFSLFLPQLFLLPSSVPFSWSDSKRLLLISDEPSLSLLSHAEEPLRCGHLLPEGVPKPPAGTLQPDPGKHWKRPCFSAWSPCVNFLGGGEGLKDSQILVFGDLKLPSTAWHFTLSGCFLGHPFAIVWL